MMASRFLLAVFLAITIVGCASSDRGADVKLNGTPVTVAGVTFRPPSEWKELGPSGMRQADYLMAPLGKGSDSASVAVYYFGMQYGGSAEENVERWISQMSMPNGSDPHKAAKRTEATAYGMKVTMVELKGTYNAQVGGMMSGKTVKKEHYLLAAAVLEAPQGKVFFKLTGPEHTAGVMLTGFKKMITEIRKAGE